MRTENEERIWHDLERLYAADPEEARADRRPERRRRPNPPGMAEVAVGGVVLAVMLVLVGAPAVGVALAAAVALVWLIACSRPGSAADDVRTLPVAGDIHANVGWRGRHPRSLGP